MPWDKAWHDDKVCIVKKGATEPLHCYPFAPGNERSKKLAEKKADKYIADLHSTEVQSTDATFTQDSPIHFELQATDEGDILVFHNAILARAEVNKNRDEITRDGINELAATIAGRPIDDEHEFTRIVGAFTAGKAIEDSSALSVDGFIWKDRWPNVAEMVLAGKKELSVEASGTRARCSVCNSVFDTSHEYCEHIMSKRAKVKHNATRTLFGLKAKGGATTFVPAGTDTKFGKELFMVASHSDITVCAYCQDEVSLGESTICPHCGIDIEAEITRRKDVSDADKEHAKKEYGDVTYADEKNKKYPVDTEEHIRAAWSYCNQAKNAAKYSPEEIATIKHKIIAAWKKKIDKEGPPSANEEKASMDENEEVKEDKGAQEEGGKEEKVEASVLEAEIGKLTAALEDYKSKLEAIEKALAEEKRAKEELETRYIQKVLSSVLDGDGLTAAVAKAKGMTLDQIDLLASVAKRPAKQTGMNFLNLSGKADNATPEKDKLTL